MLKFVFNVILIFIIIKSFLKIQIFFSIPLFLFLHIFSSRLVSFRKLITVFDENFSFSPSTSPIFLFLSIFVLSCLYWGHTSIMCLTVSGHMQVLHTGSGSWGLLIRCEWVRWVWPVLSLVSVTSTLLLWLWEDFHSLISFLEWSRCRCIGHF